MSKFLEKVKYPKLIALLGTLILAVFLFEERDQLPFHDYFLSLGYTGVFLIGLFFCYGFTSAPATALLLTVANDINIFWGGLIAGLGALVGDLLIFQFIKCTFCDEIEKLSAEKIFVFLRLKTPDMLKKYFYPVLAGFIIASPLPDEIGVSLLAFSNTMSTPLFMVMSYLLNTTGIYVMLLLGANFLS
jgi:uncharacterized membrane protein YdjX (TVP38/TMEM64 family)